MLTLTQRKAFALRAAVSGAARDEDIADKDEYLALLQSDARIEAGQVLDAPHPEEDLTSFLGRLPARLKTADIRCTDPDRRRLRRRVLLRAAGARCKRCAVADVLRRPCDGSDPRREWSLIETHGGRCIGEIQRNWQFAYELARRYYVAAVPGLPEVQVEARIEFCDARPAQQIPGHPLSFTASVQFEQTRSARRSTVLLTLSAHRYELRCADALLPALLHEAFCHVWQMAAGRPPRMVDAQYDSLAEGWMDSIVGMVVKRELGRGPGPLSPRIADAADRLHKARGDLSPGGGQDPFSDALFVRRGAGAALAVWGHCQADGGTEEEFLDLSLRLNAHPWRGTERDAACRALKEWLPKPTTGRWRLIDQALRKARIDKDVVPLIDTLRGL